MVSNPGGGVGREGGELTVIRVTSSREGGDGGCEYREERQENRHV